MQKILSGREKLILFATVGIIIFSVLFNFVIEPFFAKNDSLNKEINITRRKFRKYVQLLSQKDYIQNKYNRFSQNLKRPEAGGDIFVSALTNIEDIAKASGIRIIDIRPQTQKGQAAFKEIIVELKTEGNMEGYLKFLYNIDNSLSLLRIKKFQLSSKANSPALEGNLSISQISLD